MSRSFWRVADSLNLRNWRNRGCCSCTPVVSIVWSIDLGGIVEGTGIAWGIAAGNWSIAEWSSLLTGIVWSFRSAILFVKVGLNGLCFGFCD